MSADGHLTPSDQWQLLEKWERLRNGTASEAEVTEVNDRIQTDASARQWLAQAVLLEAELRFDGESLLGEPKEGVPTSANPRPKWGGLKWSHAAAAGFAALITWGVWSSTQNHPTVATLTKAQSCKWGNSALPTLEGSALSAGSLDLVEGMATLRFKSGAEVVMEAPVSLEIISAMECRIKRGTVVADVPPAAQGFTIQAPETKVVDWGTRFGVSASEDGKCMVHVISGLVEVERKDTGEPKKLRTGQRADYGGMLNSKLNPDVPESDQPEPDRWLPGPISDMGDGWQMLTTAFGKGRDSWIQSNPSILAKGSESYLRVKHTTLDTKLERKSYVAFDTSRFTEKEILEAEFVLHLEPSELGFASLVPDAEFAIYGLTDERQDEWSEDELAWSSAPAHDNAAEHHALPVASATRPLGNFTVPQGSTRGSFSIKGTELVDFLNADTNGIITLIIIRKTDEASRNGLVHAFATKENSRNAPPILRLKTSAAPHPSGNK
jgi:hypothetical protein